MKTNTSILKGSPSQEEAISKAAVVIKKLSITLKEKEIQLLSQTEEFKQKEDKLLQINERLNLELQKMHNENSKIKDLVKNQSSIIDKQKQTISQLNECITLCQETPQSSGKKQQFFVTNMSFKSVLNQVRSKSQSKRNSSNIKLNGQKANISPEKTKRNSFLLLSSSSNESFIKEKKENESPHQQCIDEQIQLIENQKQLLEKLLNQKNIEYEELRNQEVQNKQLISNLTRQLDQKQNQFEELNALKKQQEGLISNLTQEIMTLRRNQDISSDQLREINSYKEAQKKMDQLCNELNIQVINDQAEAIKDFILQMFNSCKENVSQLDELKSDFDQFVNQFCSQLSLMMQFLNQFQIPKEFMDQLNEIVGQSLRENMQVLEQKQQFDEKIKELIFHLYDEKQKKEIDNELLRNQIKQKDALLIQKQNHINQIDDKMMVNNVIYQKQIESLESQMNLIRQESRHITQEQLFTFNGQEDIAQRKQEIELRQMKEQYISLEEDLVQKEIDFRLREQDLKKKIEQLEYLNNQHLNQLVSLRSFIESFDQPSLMQYYSNNNQQKSFECSTQQNKQQLTTIESTQQLECVSSSRQNLEELLYSKQSNGNSKEFAIQIILHKLGISQEDNFSNDDDSLLRLEKNINQFISDTFQFYKFIKERQNLVFDEQLMEIISNFQSQKSVNPSKNSINSINQLIQKHILAQYEEENCLIINSLKQLHLMNCENLNQLSQDKINEEPQNYIHKLFYELALINIQQYEFLIEIPNHQSIQSFDITGKIIQLKQKFLEMGSIYKKDLILDALVVSQQFKSKMSSEFSSQKLDKVLGEQGLVMSVLSENLSKLENNFRTGSSTLSLDSQKHLFYNKLQDEIINLRNTLKLLDLTNIMDKQNLNLDKAKNCNEIIIELIDIALQLQRKNAEIQRQLYNELGNKSYTEPNEILEGR